MMQFDAFVVGGGKNLAGYSQNENDKVVYKNNAYFTVKTIHNKQIRIDKETKIVAEACQPICDFYLVFVDGKVYLRR